MKNNNILTLPVVPIREMVFEVDCPHMDGHTHISPKYDDYGKLVENIRVIFRRPPEPEFRSYSFWGAWFR